MNAAGTRVAIGARRHDGDRGHTRVYGWTGSAWNKLGGDIDGEAAGDFSGYSVSMNAEGDRVAIGAHSNDGEEDGGSNTGHTRVYHFFT